MIRLFIGLERLLLGGLQIFDDGNAAKTAIIAEASFSAHRRAVI